MAELVIGAEAQGIGEFPLPGNLRHRQDELLGFGGRVDQQPGGIERALCPGNRVVGEEQAFAPHQRVLPQAPTQLGIAQRQTAEHEGIAHLEIAAMLVAGVIGELVVIPRGMVGERLREARVVVVAVVDGVVQALRADPRAVAPVADDIQFTVQLEAVGDQAGAEVLVAIVQVRVHQQFAVALINPGRSRITQGVGEIHLYAIAHFPAERRAAGRRQH
ncbi:hypothetical protein D3C78_847580 [compost metagenome]